MQDLLYVARDKDRLDLPLQSYCQKGLPEPGSVAIASIIALKPLAFSSHKIKHVEHSTLNRVMLKTWPIKIPKPSAFAPLPLSRRCPPSRVASLSGEMRMTSFNSLVLVLGHLHSRWVYEKSTACTRDRWTLLLEQRMVYSTYKG